MSTAPFLYLQKSAKNYKDIDSKKTWMNTVSVLSFITLSGTLGLHLAF